MIITKKTLVQNWLEEIAIHTHLRAAVLGQDRKANFFAFNSPARLYLTHYEAIRSEQKRLKLFLKTRRVAAILDEAHKIKNPNATVSKALHDLAPGFKHRVIMTGTPVANRPYDLWSQIRFLDGGKALGDDFASFRDNLNLANDLADNQEKADVFTDHLSGLFQRIRAFSVRETKKSAGIDLPDKQIQDITAEMETRQAELYNQFRDEMAASVLQRGVITIDDAEALLKRLLRLVQVASNPFLVDESYDRQPGKVSVLERLLKERKASDPKSIIWTSFIGNVDSLARRFKDMQPARVHGKLAIADRNRAISRFKEDPQCRILIATPGAAKEGLTLTVANQAIFYDRSFSLDDYLQAQDRIHRISQKKPCIVINIIARGTIDEWVDALLTAKRLAAALGQGDIEREEYERTISYEFGPLLQKVLEKHSQGERK